jgi:alanyl-tRNA synthetase
MKDVYIVLDHTRTILITISDGSLPSNVGGGGNVRNILRRVFFVLKKNGWWEKVGMDGLLQIFESHKLDLQGIYGAFPEYKSFAEIIKVEYERWLTTDDAQALNLDKLIKKKKDGKLTIDDWITAIQSWGISADKISEVSKQPIPGNLYYEIATRQERVAKAQEKILYNTIHLAETNNLYYNDSKKMDFTAKVIAVYANVSMQNRRNLVILD